MSDRTIRTLAALVSTALLAVGCSDEPARKQPPPNEAMSQELGAAIQDAIREEWERIRSATNPTGILAEERKYSLFAEELIIRDFFQDRRGGYFVDVGCAWPIRASNTYYLEKHLGWTGIGIDALDDFAPAWMQERPGSKFFNFIVTDHTASSGTFYRSAGLGLSSVDRNAASGSGFGASDATDEIEVPMTTLDDLLDREGIEKIDLLAMDIEGHEAEALAGFDIERFQPDLVVVEGSDPKMLRYLVEHGYRQLRRYVAYDSVNRYFRPLRRIATDPPEGPYVRRLIH